MSLCKGCSKEIVWGVTADGKKVPLDPRAPVYSIVELPHGTQIVRTHLAIVSHFATCPAANDFSASTKGDA